jgi:hypothetical protein
MIRLPPIDLPPIDAASFPRRLGAQAGARKNDFERDPAPGFESSVAVN